LLSFLHSCDHEVASNSHHRNMYKLIQAMERDWSKCGVDYFCLIPPKCLHMSDNDDALNEVTDPSKFQVGKVDKCSAIDKGVILK
ncbi:hypothetical protein PFISCL1PPCAC_9811, partial [Pristionchus fissidentatus]